MVLGLYYFLRPQDTRTCAIRNQILPNYKKKKNKKIKKPKKLNLVTQEIDPERAHLVEHLRLTTSETSPSIPPDK